MAAVESFMKGFSWGQNIRFQKEEREYLQEVRKEAALERDASKFIRAYNNLRGGRSAEEFAESGDFDKLVFQYRDNKFVDDLVNDGLVDGKKAKLKSIGVEEKTGLRAFMVDTFDDKGNVISRNRPITIGRRSREEAPGDTPVLLTGGDFHNYVVAEMGQYKEFEDRWGGAARAADTAAMSYDLLFGTDTDAMQKKLDELPTHGTPSNATEQLEQQQNDEIEATAEQAAETIEASKQAPLVEPKNDSDLRGINARLEQVQTLRSDAYLRLTEKQDNLPDPRDFESREEWAAANQQALEGDPDYRAVINAQREIKELKRKQKALREEIRANPTGAAAQQLAEGILNPSEEAVNQLMQTDAFVAATTDDKKAIQAGINQGKNVGGKPKNEGQARAITRAQREMAQSIIDGKVNDRKKFQNYVKALQTQVARGEMTSAEMSANIASVLKTKAEMAKANKGNMTHATINDTIFFYDKDTRQIIGQFHVPDDGSGSGSNKKGSYLTQLKRVTDLTIEDDDPFRLSKIESIDLTSEMFNTEPDQAGFISMIGDAQRLQRAAINDATSALSFIGIGMSEEEAQQAFGRSYAPYFTASQLNVQESEIVPFLKEVQASFGGELTEQHWQGVIRMVTGLISGDRDLDGEVESQPMPPDEARAVMLKALRSAGRGG